MKGRFSFLFLLCLTVNLGTVIGKLYTYTVWGQLMCGRPASPPQQTAVQLVNNGAFYQVGAALKAPFSALMGNPQPKQEILAAAKPLDDGGVFILQVNVSHTFAPTPKLQILTDCADEEQNCRRKLSVKLPDKYMNQDPMYLGLINLETKFEGEERDCEHYM